MTRHARTSRSTSPLLVLALLAACGDDPAREGDAADAPDAADTGALAPDTTPADTTPANADRQYAVVRSVLVNGRTTVIATPGQALVVTLGFTIWSAPDCAACQGQIVFATSDGSSRACAYADAPGVHPGVREDDGEVALTAPTSPGTYRIVWALDDAASCDEAMAGLALEGATTALEFLVQ